MAVEKEKFMDLLDKFIDRSERYVRDAQERNDDIDVHYYRGQKEAIEELMDMARNWK
ncbi:hypothetical protein D3C78_1156620 [compost metagenome]